LEEAEMTLSVIGAGLGRTGTLSLKLALERLGFGPCYHTRELLKQMDAHVPVWSRAADGDFVDWDALYEGYGSAVDFPTAGFHGELIGHFPAAKVILTVRDPARWYESVKETILWPLTQPLPDHLSAWQAMLRKTVVDRIFAGNVQDREHVIAAYERHNADVMRTVAPERLLIYNVSEGWTPLCSFLGADIPHEAFPKVNTTEEFQDRIRTVFMRSGDASAIPGSHSAP
jgi:sulfotransferase family protein